MDAVKVSAPWPHTAQGRQAAYVHVPAGRYVISKSIDFTSGGEIVGIGLRGDGQLQSVIDARLTEQYPAVDMSGMAYGFVEGLSIRCSADSMAQCALLLANPVTNSFHNRQAVLRDLLLSTDTQQRNRYAVAGLVIQNGDLSRIENVVAQGPKGAIIGRYLPSHYFGNVEKFYQDGLALKASPLFNPPKVVGLQLCVSYRRQDHTERQIRQIIDYDPTSRRIWVETPWSEIPPQAALLEIFKLRSKFRSIPSEGDQTNYWISSSEFIGPQPLEFRGGQTLNLSDVYLGGGNGGGGGGLDQDHTIILVAFTGQQYPVYIRGRNIRTENQTNDPLCYALTVDDQCDLVDISGELGIVPNVNADPLGAVIRTRNRGYIQHIHLLGYAASTADGRAPRLLEMSRVVDNPMSGNLRGLSGAFRADGGPGALAGRLERQSFDWMNSGKDRLWEQFFRAHK